MSTLLEMAESLRQQEESFEIQYTESTVWVNSADGSCVGRFSLKFGIDIHTSVSEQMKGAPQCLYCTHEPPTWNDWLDFRRLIKQHFNLEVPIHIITFKGKRHGKSIC